METNSEMIETKHKQIDSMTIENPNLILKNLNKELTNFLGKHTVYETVPENTKVKYKIYLINILNFNYLIIGF